MAIGLYSPLDGLEFAEGLAETTPPFLTAQVPAPAATGVLVGANVLFTIDDLDAGIVLSTVIVSIDIGMGFVVAYTGGAFQAGFTGSATLAGFGYAFSVDKAVDLPYLTLISVKVEGSDADGNALNTTYTFTTESGIAPPGPNAWLSIFSVTPPLFNVAAAADTIRGGTEAIIMTESFLIDTTYDELFRARTLPASWSSASTGTGQVLPTLQGVIGDTRLVSGSTAGLQSVNVFHNFDVAVDVDLLDPEGLTTRALDLAVLECEDGAANIARVRVRRGVGVNKQADVAFGDADINLANVFGGIAPAPLNAGRVTLRLVRNQTSVWGFLGQRDASNVYTSLVKVLEVHNFAATDGVVRFYVGNGDLAARVRSRFSNITFRSHATIAGRLVENKRDVDTRRILCTIPAARLEDVGLADVIVFGLAGSFLNPDSFLYTLPPPRTVGRESARNMVMVQDVALKDGS